VASAAYADMSIVLLEYSCFSCQYDSFQCVTSKFLGWPQDDNTVVILECVYCIVASMESFAVDF